MVFIVYKDPTTKYEKYIERFCLRAKKKNPYQQKKDIVSDAQKAWKIIKNNIAEIETYLQLRQGERPFARYGSLLVQ